MAEVKLTVSAPKEVVDVLVALDGLVAKIIAKESVLQILAEEVTTLISLAGEISALPDAVVLHSDEALDASVLYVRRIASRLLGKSVVPVVVS